MKKIIQIMIFIFMIFCSAEKGFAQDKISEDTDAQLKEIIYNKYKKQVLAFDKKDFDNLFFEFFQKQTDSKITLTKEEFYSYTIKIAIYSEKLGLLYKDQKEEAQRAKQEWFDRSYSEYINSKH
jgi:hypothetical protein